MVGAVTGKFELCVFTVLGVAAFLTLIVVPGWPLYKMSELCWLKAEIPIEYRKKKDKESKKDD